MATSANNKTDKSKTELRIPLSGVVYREGTWWIAHCLQLDIAAEGASSAEALRSLVELVELQINTALDEGDIESVFRPAPPKIWRMFWMAEEIEFRRKLNKPIERFETRELVLS